MQLNFFAHPYRALVLVLMAMSLFWGRCVAEQPSASQPASKLFLELAAPPKDAELPSRFAVAFRLVNTSGAAISLAKFQLKSLEEPGGLQVHDDCGQAQQGIASGAEILFFCSISNRKFDDTSVGFAGALLSSWSLLTLQPSEYRFVATANFEISDERFSSSTIATIRLRPTIWQVVMGSFVGSLLLIAFIGSSPKLRERTGWAREGASVAERIASAIGFLVACIIASIMFVFLTYRLKDVSAPITVSVNDFYGGIVVGMFGYFFVDWLSSKLLAPKTPSATNGAT